MDHVGRLIELTEFERVEASSRTTLLRIAAAPTAATAPAGPPSLVVRGARRIHRLRPLPAPPARGGPLRAAYAAPSALLDNERVSYALELWDGAVVELPLPVTRPLAARQEEAPPQNGISERLKRPSGAADKARMGLPLRINRQRPRVEAFGPALPILASDDELLEGGPRPRFPYSLLLADVELRSSVEVGDAAEVAARREKLIAGIETLLANDAERLRGLGDAAEHRDEREFLRSRAVVLRARLTSLTVAEGEHAHNGSPRPIAGDALHARPAHDSTAA